MNRWRLILAFYSSELMAMGMLLTLLVTFHALLLKRRGRQYVARRVVITFYLRLLFTLCHSRVFAIVQVLSMQLLLTVLIIIVATGVIKFVRNFKSVRFTLRFKHISHFLTGVIGGGTTNCHHSERTDCTAGPLYVWGGGDRLENFLRRLYHHEPWLCRKDRVAR